MAIAGLTLVGVLVYAGTCIYGNYLAPRMSEAGQPEMPDISKAPYAIRVVNTGVLVLTARYEVRGEKGARVFLIHGYWESDGKKWLFRKRDLVLDEKIFGAVIEKKRVATS